MYHLFGNSCVFIQQTQRSGSVGFLLFIFTFVSVEPVLCLVIYQAACMHDGEKRTVCERETDSVCVGVCVRARVGRVFEGVGVWRGCAYMSSAP